MGISQTSNSPSAGVASNVPYFGVWTGNQFVLLDGNSGNQTAQMLEGTQVEQVAVLPLSKERSGSAGTLDHDRVALLTGRIVTTSYGALGAVIYDGAGRWIPWLTMAPQSVQNDGAVNFANTADAALNGRVATIRGLAYATTHALRFAQHLSAGIVICIGIFLGLGTVLLLTMLALLIALVMRRRQQAHGHLQNSAFYAITKPSPGRNVGPAHLHDSAALPPAKRASAALALTLEVARSRIRTLSSPVKSMHFSRPFPKSPAESSLGRDSGWENIHPPPSLTLNAAGIPTSALVPAENERVFFIGNTPVHEGYEQREAAKELGNRGALTHSWHGIQEQGEDGSLQNELHTRRNSHSGSGSGTGSTRADRFTSDSRSALGALPATIAATHELEETSRAGQRSSESSSAAVGQLLLSQRTNTPQPSTHVFISTDADTSGGNTSSEYPMTGTTSGSRGLTSTTGTQTGNSSAITSASGRASGVAGTRHHASTSGDIAGWMASTDSEVRPPPTGYSHASTTSAPPSVAMRTLLAQARHHRGATFSNMTSGMATGMASAGAQSAHDIGSATGTLIGQRRGQVYQRDSSTGPGSGHNASSEFSSAAATTGWSTDSMAHTDMGAGRGTRLAAQSPPNESDAGNQTSAPEPDNSGSHDLIPAPDVLARAHLAFARCDHVPISSAELPLTAGQEILIIQAEDSHWWLVRNSMGQTGVVPAACLL